MLEGEKGSSIQLDLNRARSQRSEMNEYLNEVSHKEESSVSERNSKELQSRRVAALMKKNDASSSSPLARRTDIQFAFNKGEFAFRLRLT